MRIPLYPRQFFASYEASHEFEDWKRFVFCDLHVCTHPLLETTAAQSCDGQQHGLLLGTILDPYNPSATNEDILRRLLESSSCINHLCEQLYYVGGRFLIFFADRQDVYLIGDACGLRTACYTADDPLVLASQPLLIKHHRPLREATYFESYLRSSYVANNKEHWLPVGASLFEDLFALRPNHYLRLSDLKQTRFWPRESYTAHAGIDAIHECGWLLQRLIIAASQRFSLALPITAGLDSRVLLAAARSLSADLFCYTLAYRGLTEASPDIAIPRKLMHELRLPHHVIDCGNQAPLSFQETYARNTFPAHVNDWAHIAYGLLLSYPHDRVCIKGNCSEIARCFYYPYGRPPSSVTETFLASLEHGWQRHDFIMSVLQSWLANSTQNFREAELHPLDMFYWEHRMGSWQAQSQLEWDVAQETISPFNQRQLLHYMLMTPRSERCAPYYRLYKAIINDLWPQTGLQPINPTGLANTWANAARATLNTIGVDWHIKALYRSVRSKCVSDYVAPR